MKFRYLLVLMASLIIVFSCVREEENILPIPFGKIIGNYNGTSKLCLAQDIFSDTLCNAGTPNTFRIYIHNLTTINISDETNTYDTLKLSYIKTEKTGSDATHYFESKKENSFYTLIYFDKIGSVTFENRTITDSNVTTEYFIGSK
ncbi:MAG: hypothetical protein IPN86_09635 [Saprospiraceae bacterium]|nr:hypothetical protein [Saprospiraceae bacterium]